MATVRLIQLTFPRVFADWAVYPGSMLMRWQGGGKLRTSSRYRPAICVDSARKSIMFSETYDEVGCHNIREASERVA